MLFQSTLPQREWPAICAPVKLLIYFNPHSRKGSDHLPAYNRRANRQISIHTPAKGVTFLSFGFPPFAFDFNPHSRKGSDKRRSCFWCRVEHFNPHSRKGSDKSVRLWLIIFPISIHTPAKGVTPPYFKDLIFSMYFNPHSRKGSDVIDDSTGDIISQFQSTLPQREWLCSKFQKLILDLFQSTLPQREWPQAYFKTYNDAYVSIHTPAKGVTWFSLNSSIDFRFQSTLPQREWHESGKLISSQICFNPHSRKGSDMESMCRSEIAQVSIHTPAKGVTTRRHLVLCQDLVQVKMRNFFPF